MFFPTECAFCGKYGKTLCDRCYNWLTVSVPECYVCRKISKGYKTHPNCIKNPKSASKNFENLQLSQLNGIYSRVFVGWQYNRVAKVLLKQFKFSGAYSIANYISQKLCTRLDQIGFLDINYNEKQYFNNFFEENNTYSEEQKETEEKTKQYSIYKQLILFVPIPLHKNKLKSRGFNQSALITQRLAKAYYMLNMKDLLEKVIDNKAQSHLQLSDREKNAQGLFQINVISFNLLVKVISDKEKIYNDSEKSLINDKKHELEYFAPRYNPTENQQTLYTYRIIIVDDVISTGYTLECAGEEILNSIYKNEMLRQLYFDNRLHLEAIGLFRGTKVVKKCERKLV